jgi:hypothetical protein
MKEMLETPVRLASTGSNDYGYAVLAGRSENNDTVRVLVSDFDTDYNEFAPTFENLAWQGNTFRIQVYLIDDAHDMALIEKSEQQPTRSLTVRNGINASSIYLILLETRVSSVSYTNRIETTPA